MLVAEKEYSLATAVSRALAGAGAIVVGPFCGVENALAAAVHEDSLDGALPDVDLRDDLIYPVVNVLRGRGVPRVFTTGYDRSALLPAYCDAPICEKPVELREVGRPLAFPASGAR